MEQLVARWAHNPKVVGSSPAPATRKEIRNGFLFFVPFFLFISSFPFLIPLILFISPNIYVQVSSLLSTSSCA